ncbi:MAG TPA: glycoside hydrolase family 97 N-terminal domain-containing protein, partial [Verrucomicrobiae bacterium]|nr:glycoside hydrolase family 97 N-terminal domain-containing protein [Verrucomicrobiae bacterium]
MFTTPMNRLKYLSLLILPIFTARCLAVDQVASPDGHLVAEFHLDAGGAPRYSVQIDGRPALEESRLGLVRDD